MALRHQHALSPHVRLLPSVIHGPPRLYWLTEEFYPPQIGGVELMASYLSQGLSERGIVTQVITRQTEPASQEDEFLRAVRVRRIQPAGQIKGSGWRALPRMLQYLCHLGRILVAESDQYDVVLISGMKVIPLVALPICRLFQRRCVIRVESTYELIEPMSMESRNIMHFWGRPLPRILARIQRAMLARADVVIAISAEVEEILLEGGLSPSRILRIPNAVDTDKFRPASTEERRRLRGVLGLPLDRTIVLYVGRLSRAKGVALLVDAIPGLLAHDPTLFFALVGTGKGSFDDCELELKSTIAAHGMQASVCMPGPTNHVDDYLRAADLAVFPSRYEGFGVGLIEALATGLPVIATPVGVARELLADGDNAFVSPPDDEHGLRCAVERALRARAAWPDIGKRARSAVEPYAMTSIIAQYEAVLRRLSGRGDVFQGS